MACLCRNRRIVEAVEFARQVLSPLRGVFASRSTAYDVMLADVVALLAYVNPEVRLVARSVQSIAAPGCLVIAYPCSPCAFAITQASSMKALLEQGQREAVADMVNAAILESLQHSHGRQERPQVFSPHALRFLSGQSCS